jgi:uncharacterized protein YbcI
LEIAIKTRGEIEAAICEWTIRFEQEYTGRNPKGIYTQFMGIFS